MYARKPRWNPCHVWKNRHGTYFFRFVVPPTLRTRQPGLPREIRRSLETDSWRNAVAIARVFRVDIEKWLVSYGVKNHTTPAGQGILACYMGLKLPLADGRQVEISINRDTPEEEARAAAEIVAQWPGVAASPPALVLPTPGRERVTFQRLADAYIQHKLDTDSIDEKTRMQYRASLDLVAVPGIDVSYFTSAL